VSHRALSHPYPQHIAIIMDGNGRWARKRGLPRISGHLQGVGSVRDVTTFCTENPNIHQLTLYTFSAENWKRPQNEIDTLLDVLTRYLHEERPTLVKQGVRLKVIGSLRGLPAELRTAVRETERVTARNANLLLCLAVNYGSRSEILSAVKRIARKVQKRQLAPADITVDTICRHLYTAGMPDPDLVIRTAGEKRLSNFLLWQLWYSEFYFTSTLWPDFRRQHLLKAIQNYCRRKRKFGGLIEDKK